MNKYTRMNWENTPSTATPLTADNLNHMDEGIERATDGAIALETEITTARGSSNSLGARLDTADANLANKADKTSTLAGYGIINAYTKTEMLNFLAKKEDNSNKVSSKTDITDSNTNYPSVKYLNDFYYDASKSYSAEETDEFLENKADVNSVYSKVETDNLLGNKADKVEVDALLANKANLVNSSNIFDFDAWAKELQKLSSPVYHGRLGELNFDEKSITITSTEKDTYTNSWMLPYAKTMKISVKPNTKYRVYYIASKNSCNTIIYLNGIATDETTVKINNGKGTFVTSDNTSFITLRFGIYSSGATFKVSKIMITEKESTYLPNKVAEGVPEVEDEVLAFEKTTQASLDGKYDNSNIESGTSTLTPYSTVTDKIKSASCTYKTIGDIVIVSATVKMNAVSLAGNSMCPLIDLPYKCISEDNVFCVGISNLGKLFKFAIPKNNTWLQFSTQDKTAYTFADGEQINVICLYKIK